MSIAYSNEFTVPAAANLPSWFSGLTESRWEALPNAISAQAAGNVGADALFSRWNGAAMDTDEGQLVFVGGGGHTDSDDNRVFSLSFLKETPTWQTLAAGNGGGSSRDCSTISGGLESDGAQVSTHTYGCTVYSSITQSFFNCGLGSQSCSQGTGKSRIYEWKKDTAQGVRGWVPWGSYTNTGGKAVSGAAYHPTTQHVWFSPLYSDYMIQDFDPTNLSSQNSTADYSAWMGDSEGTAAIAPAHNIFMFVGQSPRNSNPQRAFWYKTDESTTNRGNQITLSWSPNVGGPSVMWHEASDAFLMYSGNGTTIYKLYPNSWSNPTSWSLDPITATSGGVTPNAGFLRPAHQGIWGKCSIMPNMGNGQAAIISCPRWDSVPYIWKLPIEGY